MSGGLHPGPEKVQEGHIGGITLHLFSLPEKFPVALGWDLLFSPTDIHSSALPGIKPCGSL